MQTAGVPATFFINSDNLEEDPKRPGQAERNAHSLLTTIQSGHILADHSYDHMSHNAHVSIGFCLIEYIVWIPKITIEA